MKRTMHPYRALIWKELVEMSRYAAPALAAYVLLFAFELSGGTVGGGMQEPGQHFGWFGMFTGLLAAVFGYGQTGRERTPDMWAFAVHRPMSRRRIFLTKVIVGEGVLMVVAGLPFALALMWVAINDGAVSVSLEQVVRTGVAGMLMGLTGHAAGLRLGASRDVPLRGVTVMCATGAMLAIGASTSVAGIAVVAGFATIVVLQMAAAVFESNADVAA